VSRTAEEVLEFDALRALLRGYTTCAPGRRAIDALAFSHDRATLEAAFALIHEAIAWLRASRELGFGSLADPAEWLERLDSPGAALTPHELLDAASMMDTSAGLKETFRKEHAEFPLLAARADSLADLRSLAATIRRAVLPNGEISDDASSELRRIRTAIGRTRDKIQKTLREILRARGAEPGEDYVTLRNDRFVIPVRAAERRQVQGVVHGASATGQTVFVEPLETLELNNQVVQLAEDEATEIARILRELTERLQGSLGPLRHIAATLADLDSIFARARFARAFNGCLPVFTSGTGFQPVQPSAGGAEAQENGALQLRLDSARHPVLEDTLRKHGRAIVSMTLALGGEETVLVISGPNTGGKTVALKTVGLAALSAQSGIPVAAERAELPLFDRVLVDIGDEQSIAADLSTFSAHMLNLRAMLEGATPASLVLVDEMGTGTAPEEGSALAVALLEEFRARRCLTLATTHHDRLKSYASTAPGVLNAAVEFDEVNLRPTYRLLVGVPGTSSGIAIAQRLGLPAPVIERARAELAPQAREAAELIAWLHRSRDELEEIKRQAHDDLARLEDERRKLQTEWAERQRKRLAELEQRFNETVKLYEAEIRKLVGEIKDREFRTQAEKQAGRRMKKLAGEAREEADAAVVAHLSESQLDLGPAGAARPEPLAPEQLVVGARVRVRGLAQPVVIRQRDESTAQVQAGPLRMKIQLDDIVEVVGTVGAQTSAPAGVRLVPSKAEGPHAPTAPRYKPGVTVHARPADASDDINVIGCTVEEATARVDKFIDNAALAGKPRVRIIHGHGTGALRRGLAEFLSAHPLVEHIAAEADDRGGTAITVVELRP
jgi:DNA mismatch repair protein MutS2